MLWLTPDSSATAENWLVKAGDGILVYYLVATGIYILFATGFCIQVFRKYQINYPFIFEIDQSYRLIHHQFYKLGLQASALWLFCLTAHIAQFKLGLEPTSFPLYTFVLVLVSAVIWLMPYHRFYRTARQ